MTTPSASIHIKIAARLIPAWLLISLILGAFTFWLENRHADNFVFDLASKAAERYNKPRHARLFDGDPQQHDAATQAFLRETPFVGIRLYAKDRNLRYQTWISPEVAQQLTTETHQHTFPVASEHHHNKFRDASGNLHIQVVIPLMDNQQEIYGFFEGVYRVGPETTAAITERVRDALLLVLIAVGLATLALYPLIVALNRGERHAAEALLKSNVELMQTMGSAIAKRDADTAAHNYRVTLYSVELAKALCCSQDQIAALIAGAFLHDVGKIGIPDNVLLKPARLTPEEFEIIKTHVALGEDIVLESSWLKKAREVVAFHHEKFDGTGYLKGLRGEEIPINARLFAVVDVFDALTSQRPYKKAMPLEEAMAIIRQGSGSHFDPGIVDVFETMASHLHERYANADEAELRCRLAAVTRDYF